MEEIVFEIEKETKNTIRYRELESDEPAKIGAIYFQKWFLKKLGGGKYPKKVKVNIEVTD